jgi:diacylglycerol kinase
MIKKRLASFGFAFKGIETLILSQPNARIHLVVALIVISAGIFFHLNQVEWMILTLTIAMVFAAEGFNTALEFLTDLASPGYHELAGKTKDVAAGAVLIMAIGAIVIGMLIFVPKIAAWL